MQSNTKQITLEVSKEPTRKIKEKEKTKRQITTTNKWQFSENELETTQILFLCDTSKTPLLYQQIKNKLSSYRSQDIEKNVFSEVIDLSGVLHKLQECNLLCFYCKEPTMLFYENVREPKQWTLERLNNSEGHHYQNVVIACLSCNVRRRTMKYEKYVMTKNIRTVVKQDSISPMSHQIENTHPDHV
jgi:hypothetical protein